MGYRVKSQRGVQFRQWATQTLKQHLVQGCTLNQKRLKERGIEFEQVVSLLSQTLANQSLVNPEGAAVIFGMTLTSIIFLPAPIIGYAMASNEINNFTCTPKPTSLIEPCATVSIDEGEPKIGNILHTDSTFLYIFTKDGAEAIPLEKIKSRLRPINKKYSNNQK